MKLPAPFIQLPLLFDADALAAEIGRFDESMWRAHPDGIPGNSALPLAAVDGDPLRGDALQGPMRPTQALQESPYLRQVLGSLQAVLGRIRLMRLAGGSEVSLHADTNHYWNERVRVHVPILTRPTVRFQCGDAEVNMAAGECWIFDTWRLHRVLNDDDRPRVHLVVDTIGSPRFWRLAGGGRSHLAPREGWQARMVAPDPSHVPELEFESVNLMTPMTFWEVRGHVQFLLSEMLKHPNIQAVAGIATAFVGEWQALWYRFGSAAEGAPMYRKLLDGFLREMHRLGSDMPLHNGASLAAAASGLLGRAAPLPDVPAPTEESSRSGGVGVRPARGAARIEQPVFVVSSPRSGSTLMFETLAQAPGLHTIGGEGHGVVEGIPGLDVPGRGYDSNRLAAADATPAVAASLRERYAARLVDREGRPPAGGAVRMLEKTPKNALRIPFLREVFPGARFVYLWRDPREVLASMMEAWESGGFRTYPDLPGWSGLPWSLLLVPGWRELIGKPLAEVVAAQWATTTATLLDDLGSIDPERIVIARYDSFLAAPEDEMRRIAGALGLGWDRALGGELPLANHTVSAPAADKWRRREAEILAALEPHAGVVERAAAFAGAPLPA
ncbi:MAG: sulfotransferase [Xanthomonadales bacterium]|nr:sulfotransferase [Xanthomonadales bacterium]